jgi:hypothetical protein
MEPILAVDSPFDVLVIEITLIGIITFIMMILIVVISATLVVPVLRSLSSEDRKLFVRLSRKESV